MATAETSLSALAAAKLRTPERKLWIWIYGFLATVIAVIGAFTYWHIREHIIETLDDRLEAALRAQVAALEQWVESEQAAVRGWAEEPDIKAAVRELTDDDGNTSALDRASRERINRELTALLRYQQPLRYAMFSLEGEMLTASRDALLRGQLTEIGRDLLEASVEGATIVTVPMRPGTLLKNAEFASTLPAVVRLTPIYRDDGTPMAILVVVSTKDVFDDVFEAGRFGTTGQTYAVDGSGRLISSLKDLDRLADAGGLDEMTAAGKGFGLPIVRNAAPFSADATLPESENNELTVAAQGAVSRKPGRELDGYRDYRGRAAIGAWRWHDDLGIGLISEIDHTEAFRPLTPLIVATSFIFVLFVATATGLVIYFRRAARLRGELATVRELGQYKIMELVGEGGMGKVFRARHALLARDTAIKVLKPEIVSEDNLRRFEKEVRHTASLQHPNTIEIYDFGRTEGGLFYYAMEYLDGLDLGTFLRRHGPMPPGRVVHILSEACFSLREAHASGLLHRDIKPDNIMLTVRGGIYDTVKVLDFGLVMEMAHNDPVEVGSRLIPGTPPYIAPERMRPGASVDGRVDIYALGAVGFALLAGRPVFEGASSLDIAHKTLSESPPRVSTIAAQMIPAALDDLIYKALSAKPESRLTTVDDMIETLDIIARQTCWTQTEAASWWEKNPLPGKSRKVTENGDVEAQGAMAIDLSNRPSGTA